MLFFCSSLPLRLKRDDSLKHLPLDQFDGVAGRQQAMVHTDVSWTKDDLYLRLKDLKRQMEFSDIQEEYIKDDAW